MMKRVKIAVADIYVPTKRRATLDPAKAQTLSNDIMANGLTIPIQVREDGARYVLVEGLHRFEAHRLLGETHIDCYLVQARKH